MELIVATGPKYEIGYKGKLPWNIPEDLRFFKSKTLDKTIVVGRRTAAMLPHLDRRTIICLTRGNPDTSKWNNDVKIVKSLDEITSNVVIAGGAQIYREALRRPGYVKRIYLTRVHGEHNADTYFDREWLRGFVIVDSYNTDWGSIKTLEYKPKYGESQYLILLKRLLNEGIPREGRNGTTLSLFVNHFEFDLRSGFPLLTTKRMFLRGILEEFLFFLRGDTDTTCLSKSNVRIWEGNTSKEFIHAQGLPYAERVMGPMYGYQWRFFGSKYILDDERRPLPPSGGVDQLAKVVNLIRTDPNSRRILLTSYNPAQVDEGVLYPCHSIITQFYVHDDYLDMFCYNRSQDTFLGVPYNIASSALLLHIVSKLTRKTPRHLKITMGDTHLYQWHMIQAKRQINRIPFQFPRLDIPDVTSLCDVDKLVASDFKLREYRHHPAIKATMVV